MRTILLTGITGNLGADMARRLLAAGHHVLAPVRSRRNVSHGHRRALEAIRLMSGTASPGPAAEGRLHILDLDVADADAMAAARLPASVDETWHFASSLKYMPKDRDEIHGANVLGTRHVLALHRRHASSHACFNYVSTAYLAGRSLELVPEARVPYHDDLAFNNEYEKSKLLAENEVLDAIERGTLHGNVYRPSIVVANPDGGGLANFNGFYLGLKAWFSLSDYMRGQGQAGERVRLWVEPANALNLIPIGATVGAIADIARRAPPSGMVFNVVNERPPTLSELFAIINQYLDIECTLVGSGDRRGAARTTYEKLVAYSLTYVSPYIKQRIAFATDNVRSMLGRPLAMPMYPDGLDSIIRRFRERGSGAIRATPIPTFSGDDSHAHRAPLD